MKELSHHQTSKTHYSLDEPTTDLHLEDVRRRKDVIKSADWTIDLGTDGGGTIVATLTPKSSPGSPVQHRPSPEI